MLKLSTSYSMLSINPSTAYLLAQYGPNPGTPSAPDVELKIKYLPAPLSRKCGSDS